MWSEFNKHFKNPNREQGHHINHHDFLDANFLKNKEVSRKNFFAKMGGQSMQVMSQSHGANYFTNTKVDLGYDRLSNA